MPSNQDSLLQRAESSFRNLLTVASDLNSVSDELGKSVGELDSALKKLNLGITVWVTIQGDDGLPDDPSYWSEDLGYCKVDGKWGLALRTVRGDYSFPDGDQEEKWLFNDAPRSLRLSAISKIPELLEMLSFEASKAATEIRAKLTEAQKVAEVVKKAAQEPDQIAPRPVGTRRIIATGG